MDFIAFLEYFGFTREAVTPLIVLGVIALFLVWRHTRPIREYMSRMAGAILEIQTIFQGAGVDVRCHLGEAPGSPLKPTELGWKWMRESGLDKIIDENYQTLADELKKVLPKEPAEYDVQEKGFEVLMRYRDEEIMKPVKEYAYDNGLQVDSVIRLGRLLLRDKYLEDEQN